MAHTHEYIITYVHIVYTAFTYICTYNRNAKRCDNEKYLVFYYKYQRRLRPAPKPQQQQQHIRSATPSPLSSSKLLVLQFPNCARKCERDSWWMCVSECCRTAQNPSAKNCKKYKYNTKRTETKMKWRKSETNGKRKRQNGWQTHKQHKKNVSSSAALLSCWWERDEIDIMQPAGQQLLSRFSCKNSFNMRRTWEVEEGEKFVIYFFNWN